MTKEVTERHGWLRNALADHGFTAREVAKRWKCNEAVVARYIARGEGKMTVQRVIILAKMLKMDQRVLLVRLAEKPVDYTVLQSQPLPIVAGFAQLFGMDSADVIKRLSQAGWPVGKKPKKDDEWGGW